MPTTPPMRSSLSSLVASRRRRRGEAEPAPAPRAEGIVARLSRTGAAVLEGHVFDAGDPDRRFVVELVLNGLATAVARAELFDAALGPAGGDGCHGFCFHIDPAMLPELGTAAVRIANTGESVGEAVDFAADGDGFAISSAPQGGVEWSGGLQLSGWLPRDAAPFPALVEAWVDGARVAWTRADRWRSVSRGDGRTAEPGFELALPRELADGRAKTVDVLCEGRPVPGSPVRLIAFANGLRLHLSELAETAAEAELGRLFDDAFPASVPFASFEAWEKRFPMPPPEKPWAGTLAVAVVGTEGAEKTLSGPAFDTAEDWVGTMLPADGAPHRFAPSDLLAFLAAEKQCEAVLLVAAGAKIRPFLPARLAGALLADQGADIAYGDVLIACGDGTTVPLALPAFDYERALEQGIGSSCFLMRRGAAIAAAERGADDLHRLFLGPVENAGVRFGTHLHVPGFGAVLPQGACDAEALARSAREHLAARGRAAAVAPRPAAALPAVRVSRRGREGSLAVVLDAGSDPSRVGPALVSLEAGGGRKDVRIVVSAGAADADLRRELQLIGAVLCEAPTGTSAARRMAAAVESAGTELVCVLDARLRPAAPGWLDELLGRFAEDDVGVAAPLVLHSCGLVAEAGLVLGPAARPRAAFADRRHGDPGYGDALLVARQVAAVGPACFLTRRADFIALGGFDPLFFPDRYGSVDYCLKLQALGRRVVVTPDAVLAFPPGTDAEPAELPAARAAREREERALRSRWAAVLANEPFYSPLLNRGSAAFAGLAWPPGNLAPRHSSIAQPRAVPPGW